MSAPLPSSKRLEFLDWLRVIAIFVLIFYHTGMVFVGWGWHIENTQTLAALELPMSISQRLRMPLLFLIAGAGLWFASARRSAGQLAGERTLRLLIPVIVGMILLVPPQVYFERLHRGQWSGDYISFFFERVLAFQPYPEGDLSWHHLWFIVYLFVYSLLLIPLLLALRARQPQLRPGLWLFALTLPLALNEIVLEPYWPATHDLIADWYVFINYLLLTTFGLMLARMPGAWDWLMQQRQRALLASSVVTAVLLGGIYGGVFERQSVIETLLANAFTWCWLLTMCGYGRRYLSFSNRLLIWARDASYPVYILHQTVIVTLAYLVVDLEWTPWAKYLVILLLTIAICALVYELVIRRFEFIRLMFGLKKGAHSGRAHTAAPSLQAE